MVVLLENLLILAGVGSGKICVLVYWIVWLMLVEEVLLFLVMVVIFINKVVVEMCGWIEELMYGIVFGMWCGIFYGICYCILCVYYFDVKLLEDF